MSSVLVIDDDPVMQRYLHGLLESGGHDVRHARTEAEAGIELRRSATPDAVLLALGSKKLDGLEVLAEALELQPETKVLVVADASESGLVVQAIKMGATGFINKPLRDDQVHGALRAALAYSGLQEEPEIVHELDAESFFLAASPAMRGVFEQVRRMARVDVPVLITGESGTGKEVIAKLLHQNSQRSGKRFLKVNCAAIPDDLLESELFGYEAGAFTGATSGKPGYFEQCNHGTILLDEIGEMAPRLQAKLLQVLQDQRFFRLGGRSPVEVNVRVLAATNINVKEAIAEGKLRLDLYYRLNAFSIALPPLRERKEEIAPLFEQFTRRLAKTYRQSVRPLTPALTESLNKYSWPGNLRELQNVAKRYLVLGDETVASEAIPVPEPQMENVRYRRDIPGSGGTLKHVVREIKKKAEAEAIRNALEQTQGGRKEAAELLGICYKAFVYKSRQYGILGPSNREKKRAQSATAEDVLKKMSLYEGPAVSVAGGRKMAVLRPLK